MNLLTEFHAAKLYVVEVTGLARDTLHLHFGLALMLIVALLFRRSLASPWPWLSVVLFAALGEYLDRRDSLALGAPWSVAESVKDFLNTLFWPTMLVVLTKLGVVLKR